MKLGFVLDIQTQTCDDSWRVPKCARPAKQNAYVSAVSGDDAAFRHRPRAWGFPEGLAGAGPGDEWTFFSTGTLSSLRFSDVDAISHKNLRLLLPVSMQ